MQATQTFKRLGKVSSNLPELQEICQSYRNRMFDSNNYAPGRKEVHIRRFIRLPNRQHKTPLKIELTQNILGGTYLSKFDQINRIEALGDRLLPGFHQGILMFYPTGTFMKTHKDHPVYDRGAVQVNVKGIAKLQIGEESHILQSGDCIWFDNFTPHAVCPVEQDRWTICFFKLKKKHLSLDYA
jgi:hypothetical protein